MRIDHEDAALGETVVTLRLTRSVGLDTRASVIQLHHVEILDTELREGLIEGPRHVLTLVDDQVWRQRRRQLTGVGDGSLDAPPIELVGLAVDHGTGLLKRPVEYGLEPADPGLGIDRTVHQLPARLQQQFVVDQKYIVLGAAFSMVAARTQQRDDRLAGAGAGAGTADDQMTAIA